MTAAGTVLVETAEGLATVTLNRPEHGNRITPAMFDFLAEALDGLARDNRCRVVVLRGAGADFCLGRESSTYERPPSALELKEELSKITRANYSLERFPGISIALVRGRALGAGCSLAGRCDLVVATEDAQFGFPEIGSGLAPTIVMSYFCKRLPRRWALELVLTGQTITAVEAQRIGLINRVVPGDRMEAEIGRLVGDLLQRDPAMLRACKEFALRLDEMSVDAAAEYGINLLANLLASRR